jgi:hypothetical protein
MILYVTAVCDSRMCTVCDSRMCNLVHNMQVGVRFWGSVSKMISRLYAMIDVASIQAVSVLIGSRMRAGLETGGWVL